jgi:hypothetical protein
MGNQLDKTYDIQPDQSCTVSRFQPEDAEGVAKLFLSVYGTGYPIRAYIEPETLIAENAAHRIISSVAKTASGEVVAHNALYRSAPHPGTYESGAGLVHMSYRGSKGLFYRVFSHSFELADALRGVDCVFGEPVCNHVIMQKMVFKMGYITRALEVDLMPAAAYQKEASADGRVAALFDFKTYRSKPHTVYLPRAYEAVWPFFYDGLDDERDFRFSGDEQSPAGVSDIRYEFFGFSGVVRVAVHSTGADFSERLYSLEKNMKDKGAQVFQVWLNLADTCTGAATKTLRRGGYFLGGVLPRWFGTDGLLMQKIIKRPDWEGIHVYSERAASILEKVRADWEQSQLEENIGN